MRRELAREGADHSSRLGKKLGRKGKECAGGRDLELPRPDHQVRGEGVRPGADTQVSK